MMTDRLIGQIEGTAAEVADVGRAFLPVVGRVCPAHGDPVGRAMFEAGLGEIGMATNRSGAVRRVNASRQRTRGGVGGPVAAISLSAVIDLDAEVDAGRGFSGDAQPSTEAMNAYAAVTAERKPSSCRVASRAMAASAARSSTLRAVGARNRLRQIRCAAVQHMIEAGFETVTRDEVDRLDPDGIRHGARLKGGRVGCRSALKRLAQA